jgi:hypothetical protein
MTTKITNTVEAITIEDTQNAYAWGKKNLSAARYRAFDRQMSELGRNKTSAEYRAAWKATQEIEDAHLRASAQRIEEIKTKAQAEADMIQKQIDELSARKRKIADAMYDEVTKIRCEVYSSPAYLVADAKRMEEGEKDLAIFLPKVQKLMQKFLNLQLQADTDAAVEEMSRA